MKDVFRSIGIGCILAAGILYFTQDASTQADDSSYKDNLKAVTAELERVKKELAIAQTNSMADQQQSKASTNKKDDSKPNDPVQQITKTILTIEQGSTSTSVANKLVRAGIIENKNELEHYLNQNKLSGRIQIGEYEVDSSMDIPQIAKLITN
ncbi:hypothetical protein [Sporosarcina sp. OR05]|uniref:hypothetical protein n=1 Tax=Sporosarcina sp. OR05 TaxID=2969819 RepID=UPI00352B47EF